MKTHGGRGGVLCGPLPHEVAKIIGREEGGGGRQNNFSLCRSSSSIHTKMLLHASTEERTDSFLIH